MIDQLSFIHAADLHLDSPFKGLAHTPEPIFNDIRDSTFKALHHLVEAAIKKNVDFVLLAGDSFDNEVQSLKAQIRLRDAFEKLNDYHIHVYISYGNHDYKKGNIHSVTYPENVHVFPDEKVTHFTYYKNNKKAASIYGFSYESRSVTEKKVSEYTVEDQTVPFHIAMLHGSLQSNTTHDTYAPFQLHELTKQPFDYWALGHIHQKEILQMNPPVIYSGNTQGRHRGESGERGCYHVVLSKTQPVISFVPLHAIQFNNVTLETEAITDIYEVEQQLQQKIKQLDYPLPLLILVTFRGNHDQLNQWETQNYLTESIELVNEWGLEQPNWRYVYKHRLDKLTRIDETSIEADQFIKELLKQFETEPVAEYIEPLYNHPRGRKYLEHLSHAEFAPIKKAAHQLLLQELRGKGSENN